MLKFVILLIIVVNAIAQDQEENRSDFLLRIAQECMKESGVDEKIAQNLMASDLSNKSQEAKCFLKCIFVKEGFFDENEKPRPEYIITALKDPQNIEIMKNCMQKDGVDSCDLAYNILQCYIKTSSEKLRRQKQMKAENQENTENTNEEKSEL